MRLFGQRGRGLSLELFQYCFNDSLPSTPHSSRTTNKSGSSASNMLAKVLT